LASLPINRTVRKHELSDGYVNHVSRGWREVALSIATLWASVVCVFPSAFDTFVSRAQDAPLSIKYHSTENLIVNLKDYCQMLLRSHPDRVKFSISN
jgi:hypothetical protein